VGWRRISIAEEKGNVDKQALTPKFADFPSDPGLRGAAHVAENWQAFWESVAESEVIQKDKIAVIGKRRE
jgi:hypothetical protein